MTDLDWAIIGFAVLMGFWGYRQGLIVGALSLLGFGVGAFLGSRLGPALLADGSESPYAPATALAGALLIGGIAAVSLEGIALLARRRLLGTRGRRRLVAIADAAGGAALLAAVGLGLAWLFGAVALNAPGAKNLRQSVQESVILRELNEAVPPSGGLLNALNRVDPGVSIRGPEPNVGPPDSALAEDPEVQDASGSVVRVLGTACGLSVSGTGWIAAPGVVVTNAHVIAGQDDTAVSSDGGSGLEATPVHYDPGNDLALLRTEGLAGDPLPLVDDPSRGTAGAVLGFPENGPLVISAARLGTTGTVVSEDSYGRGPVQREMTALRGDIRRGNSGGPMVDGDGRVLTTVFAATTEGTPAGYGVPNDVVGQALSAPQGEVDTGPCT